MFKNYNEILSVDELCEILSISRNTAYDLLRRKTIRSFRIGRTWKIPLASLKDFVMSA